MIEIYGASDDCIEVYGCEGAGEFDADGKGCWQADLVAPGGTDQMRVRAGYDPDGSGCWVISLSQVDESVPFPAWGNGTGQAPNGYSTLVRIDAPGGTRLANVSPGAVMTTTTETAPAAAKTIAYHWVMTLQGPAARQDGWITMTVDGSANLPPGMSRATAYHGCMQEAQRIIRESEHGRAFAEDPATVLFFSLEKDEL